ncbi:MAG TPA: DUF2851 family protein [Dehalococcoidia bacterium]|nr:DUF2851 family protein [Dehalococcoidia bacterium]
MAERPAPYSPRDHNRPISEQALARLWQRRAARRQWFRTDRGVRVRVLYPGRPGKAAGPDFHNALLEFEGVGLVQGDVEIHLRQRDWGTPTATATTPTITAWCRTPPCRPIRQSPVFPAASGCRSYLWASYCMKKVHRKALPTPASGRS